jgi:hypothetical protein
MCPPTTTDNVSSVADDMERLNDVYSKACNWETNYFPITVATSLLDDTPQVINLANTMGKKPSGNPYTNNPKAQSKYLLPAEFNQNTRAFRKYTLSPIFEHAAQSQGFNVTMKGWEQQYNKIRFICRRGRFAQLKKEEAGTSPTTTDNDYRIPLSTHRKRKKKKKGNKSKAKNTPVQRKKAVNTTGMPVKGLSEKCPFQFCVYWDPNINRWFLPAEQQGSLQHCGHLWCQPELVSLPVKALPRDEIIMASDGTKEFMKASMLEALLFHQNATTIPTQKLQYFQSCQKRMAENPMLSFLWTGEQSHDANLPMPSTPADLILADLDADPSSSYVAMYGKYDSELLTIHQKHKRLADHSVEEMDLEDHNDGIDSAQKSAEKIRGNLSVTGTGMILLGLAWTEDSAAIRFSMYPEAFGLDVTENTNSEGCPLALCVGLDHNNQTFMHTMSFLPSQAKWSFNWLLRYALPHLHTKFALNRVQCIFSDGDPRIHANVDNLCGPGKLFPKACRRNCAFHKLDRNCYGHSDFLSSINALKAPQDIAEWQAIVGWLWSIIKDTETKQETELMVCLLNEYLDEDESSHKGSLGSGLKTKLCDYLTKSFEPDLGFIAGHAFVSVLSLQKTTSTMVEIENSALRRRPDGIKCCHHIAETKKRLSSHGKQKDRAKKQRTLQSLDRIPSQVPAREVVVDGITKYCNNHLQTQHRLSNNYVTYRVSDTTCYVKLKPVQPEQVLEEEPDRTVAEVDPIEDAQFLADSKQKQHLIPRFKQTRVVQLLDWTESLGDKFLVCSCPFFRQMGMCCQPAIFTESPMKTVLVSREWQIALAIQTGGQLSGVISEYCSYISSSHLLSCSSVSS